MKNSRDLILGDVIYISSIICLIRDFIYSRVTIFMFDHMTDENHQYLECIFRPSSAITFQKL